MRIGDDVGGIVGILGPAQHVPQHRAVVRGVHGFETVPALLLSVWWRTRQDGSLRAVVSKYQAHVRLPPSISPVGPGSGWLAANRLAS